ncbi:DUF1190 domain-containing protein [Pseudomonas sp. RIT-To-2]|uniref:DUF1190 domain-containing protein n=1 Tax=Pseudomonas sp. RIT-To-2 TaxID=3462541 RepID=UPI002413027B
MKRSKYVQLSLAASVALAVAGCGAPEKTYQVKKTFDFKTVAECTAQKFPVDVCSDAYIAALSQHRKIAPVYDNKADCEADFVPDYCQVDSAGKYMPQLGGFEVDADGTVTQSQLDSAKAEVARSGGDSSGGGFNGSGLLTGLLIGHMLSSSTGNFRSAPVYQYRDDRGNYASSTLGSRINSGATFSRSRQSESGNGYSSGGGSFGRINANPVSVRQATTRGGFGSSATARSGWSGSSSRSSFGG